MNKASTGAAGGVPSGHLRGKQESRKLSSQQRKMKNPTVNELYVSGVGKSY